jgi:hypothetical protein
MGDSLNRCCKNLSCRAQVMGVRCKFYADGAGVIYNSLFMAPVLSYCCDTVPLGESPVDHPGRDAEAEQHRQQHKGDKAARAGLFTGQRPGDAEGIDEQIDDKTQQFHGIPLGRGGLMRRRPARWRNASLSMNSEEATRRAEWRKGCIRSGPGNIQHVCLPGLAPVSMGAYTG